MFRIIVGLKEIAKCKTFKTAFTIFLYETKKLIKDGVSKQVLYETCWIDFSDGKQPLFFLKVLNNANDNCYLSDDGELID